MRWTLILWCAWNLAGQSGTDPKLKPEDYEAHGQARDAAIGAEFMIHSFSGQGLTYVAPDFLVEEVAVYPSKGTEMNVQAAAFSLRLNGKTTLQPVGISLVSSSLQHPEYRQEPHLEAGAGTNGGGVVLGAPRQTTQVPGEPPRPAQPYPVPGSDEDPLGGGAPREPRISANELLTQTALPEGKYHTAVSGYIYFQHRGKASSLKTVELLFQDAVLKLR